MKQLEQEIKRRRTFAIISHPDAGKTTLTEKFLLYGGAIALAGSVKGKKTAKHAVSDWMEIEKQRGISVTSSVMQFQYKNYCINILDTPGHQDFSEDTYRTLMAADSAVMVIDASKGVENQTRKLFKVCVMRHIPIFTFINKMDRESRNPFDLLDQIEQELGIKTYPVNWPIGCGKEFKGVFDREKRHILSFEANNGQHEVKATEVDLHSPELDGLIGTENRNTLLEDVIAEAYSYLGTPYRYGGTSRSGIDCSGFTMKVFGAFGISLPHGATSQYRMCRSVTTAERAPGDLVFFATGGSGIGHVGIYLGGGQFIHSSTSSGVIISSLYESYYARTYLYAARLIDM